MLKQEKAVLIFEHGFFDVFVLLKIKSLILLKNRVIVKKTKYIYRKGAIF